MSTRSDHGLPRQREPSSRKTVFEPALAAEPASDLMIPLPRALPCRPLGVRPWAGLQVLESVLSVVGVASTTCGCAGGYYGRTYAEGEEDRLARCVAALWQIARSHGWGPGPPRWPNGDA